MGLVDLRQRLDEFASRFTEKAAGARSGREAGCPPGLSEDYWTSVHALFTRDVTSRGLKELVHQETRDTLRFFTRDVDLSDLTPVPWYKRYPLSAWRVFLHMAFRLSPARRVLFAVAVPLLILGWVGDVLHAIRIGWPIPVVLGLDVLLIAATLLFFLLVLELRDKLTLKGDLEIARQIQFGLLPFEPYESQGTVACALMRPANTVGGDYFDLIDLGDERLAVAMGDVAGKGMPAALLMALLQASLQTLITAGFRGSVLVEKLNDHLCAHIPSNRLVTLFYGEYETSTGVLRYVNAGHNAPFLLRGEGGFVRLPATGVALGIVPGAAFETGEATLAPGERVVLFTDGVSEAFDTHEREYGEERLGGYLASHGHLDNPALLEGVREDVLAFCGMALPSDDMTLMVLAREGSRLSQVS